MKKLYLLSVLAALSWFLYNQVSAEVPQMINYQGKLTKTTGAPLDTTIQMVFSIYADSNGTTSLWTETQSAVVVEKGVFNVLLGSVVSIPYSVFDGSLRYLGVKVGDDPEITPRKPMVSVAYAYKSIEADTADYARVSMPDNDWFIDGDNIYHLNGNVGIGTTTPSVKLHVSDARYTDGAATNLATMEQLGYGAPVLRISNPNTANSNIARMLKIQVSGSYDYPRGLMGMESSHDLGLITDNSERVTITNSGNVGIGTTSPGGALEISRTGSTPILKVYSNRAGDSQLMQNRILFGGSNNQGWSTPDGAGIDFHVNYPTEGPSSNAQLRFWAYPQTTSTPTMTVNGGNVGIGTSTPGAKLDVAGSIRSSAGGFLFPDGSVQTTAAGTSLWGTSGSDIYNTNSGRVVIGPLPTGDPTTKLQIVAPSPQILIRDTGAGVNQNIGVDGNGLSIYFDGGPALTVKRDNGNVGIGTTSPAYKLDVAGDIRSTGTIHGNFDGTINNALLWNGHSWGDTYPYSSNSDLVDGIHGTQFLRNDQSGTLSGSVGDYQAVLNVLNSGEGRSIYASTNASMNRNAAIYGDALDDGGVGVYGHTSSPGLYIPHVDSGSSVGVFGLADNSGGSVGGAAMGVFGRVYSYQNSPASVPVGVFGEAMHSTGVAWGVAGESHSTSPSAAGVKGTLKASGAQGRAIWGEAPTTGWAGYFAGNVHVTGNLSCSGSKPALLHFSDGKKRFIYSQESPEIWFEDFGEAELENGHAHIYLDALFLETVTISDKFPMKVFVQLNDDCKGVYVKRGTTGFDVYELDNGKSNASFTYRVVAKRKGYEDKRLEQFEGGVE